MTTLRAAAVALLTAFGAASAQQLRGVVTQAGSNTPLAGVVLTLVDSSGTEMARSLSADDGGFRLLAPTAGSYRLRAIRIGSRPSGYERVVLVANDVAIHNVELETIPFALERVQVRERSLCSDRGAATEETYALWEQARAAFIAALLTAQRSGLEARILSYERELDPSTRRVRRQTARTSAGFAPQAWRALSSDSLHAKGYVARLGDGSITYYAPDLTVLISATFLEDHCLRSSRHDRLLRIDFEPAKHRSGVAEIGGSLDMDAETLRVRELRFRYVNDDVRSVGNDGGGLVEFAALPAGLWVVSGWKIEVPVLQLHITRVPGLAASASPELTSVAQQVTGGELVLMTRGRDTVWARPSAVLRGVVVDSATRKVVAGAVVSLRGSGRSAVTDTRGRFGLSELLPGDYAVEVRTTALDSLAGVYVRAIGLAKDSTSTRLEAPSTHSLLSRWCPAAARGDRTPMGPIGLLTGVVRQLRDSTPIASDLVRVTWKDISVSVGLGLATRMKTLEAATDSVGVYRLCGVPVNVRLELRVGADTTAVSARIPAGSRFLRLDLPRN